MPERKRCGKCRKALQVQKTRSRCIATSNGKVNVTDVSLQCAEHKEEVFTPVNTLTPLGSEYGFDLITEIGQLRTLEHKQIAEIRDLLRIRGIPIPPRTIFSLSDKFLLYTVATHLESLPLLAQYINQQGGYVLHVDGSGRHGPMVMLFKDSWSNIRLLASRVPSEGSEHISPYLRMLKHNFGLPVAVIRDMSDGIRYAVSRTFPDTYVIVCHYHFLRNVGLMLFDKIYPTFRNKVDRRGVKGQLKKIRRFLKRRKKSTDEDTIVSRIIDEILDYEKDAKGLAYPFSLPNVDFYRRCDTAIEKIKSEIHAYSRRNEPAPLLCEVRDILCLLKPPPIVIGKLQTEYDALNVRWQWFQRVRRALRYRNGPIPLSTQITQSEADLEKGRKKLDWIIEKIREFDECGGLSYHDRKLRKALCRLRKSIDEHRNELFAPNVMVNVNGKSVIKRLPRTNSPEETDFRLIRRHGCRIRGTGDVESQVQRNGVGLLISLNLANQRYVRLVYGGLNRMAERFSKVKPESLIRAKSLICGLDK